jgi:hypothetical protein
MKKEIENVIAWLEASKEEFIGETKTNALFLVEHLKKVLEKDGED